MIKQQYDCLDEQQGDCLAVQVGAVLEEIGGQFLFEFKISILWKNGPNFCVNVLKFGKN